MSALLLCLLAAGTSGCQPFRPNTPVPPSEATLTPPQLRPLGEHLRTGVIQLFGTAVPGSHVRVRLDEQEMGIALVDPEGKWSFNLDVAKPGDHQLFLDGIDDRGQRSGEAVAVKMTVE